MFPRRALLALLLFIATSVSAATTIATRFTYAPAADARLAPGLEVKSVSVAGSFNGWNRSLHLMTRQVDGVWSVSIPLSGGLHYYKFVVNNEIWLEDMRADSALRQDDGQGHGEFNSGVRVASAVPEPPVFTGPIRDVPDWARDVVWYQIFPERFRNGDPANDPTLESINEGAIPGWRIKDWGSDWYALDTWETEKYGSVFQSIFRRRYGGDLQGILDKLDYLESLGVTAIYLNPVFRSPSLHKYDGSSFHHIEETFGPDPEGDRRMIEAAHETEDPATWVWTSADRLFLKLVEEVHRRGMKIIIDGVFNHSGRTFFAFEDLRKNGRASRYTNWYSITRWDESLADGFEYKGWFGIHSLPEFRRDESGVDPSYQRYVYDITKRWMAPEGEVAKGVDGWRLDVAFCLPHPFWKEWRQHVKGINPEAYITGEVVEIAPDYLRGDEFDGLMNYPFAYAAVEFFVDRRNQIPPSVFDRRLAELRDAYPPEITRVMQNLYTSHDCSRLFSIIVNPDMNFRDFGGHFNKSKVENTPSYRIDRGGPGDLATHKQMVTFQMTYLGAPMIYYGNEVGMTGANDPDCRKPMIWDDIVYEDEAVHPHAGVERPREVNAANAELLEHYRKLIRIRNENVALRRGDYATILVDDARKLFGFSRALGRDLVMVILNNDAAAHDVELDVTGEFPREFEDLLLSGRRLSARNGKLRFTLPPSGAVVLQAIHP
jgi:cyclomaltodextrinase / maltogenic alpha-amylase / neopullulanase